MSRPDHQTVHSLLEDYLDEELPVDEARMVERHLGECRECRMELDSWRALRREASALPRSIQPARDLWRGINEGLERERLRDRSIWSLRYPLAAAAVLLILLSSVFTALVWDRGSEGRVASETSTEQPETTVGAILAGRWRAAEEEYLKASAELLDALDASRAELDPATLELIERNLRIIDAAIQESRAALAKDPSNREVMQMLSASYEKKLELLRYASRLTAEL